MVQKALLITKHNYFSKIINVVWYAKELKSFILQNGQKIMGDLMLMLIVREYLRCRMSVYSCVNHAQL
jgi:hypothetical protein